MNHLGLVGPPDLVARRIAAVPGLYRIGRGEVPGVAVSFEPGDERRRQNLLAWFERGAEPGATLLVDDWKYCCDNDPGLADTVRWIAAASWNVRVIVTARALDELPERLPLRVEVLDFLSLHGMARFTKALAWKGRWWKVPVGVDESGAPVVVELTHFADGKWRTGSHLAVPWREAFRSLVLGLMTTHSPKLFQAWFIDAHDSDVFDGLDRAPHVVARHRHVARDPHKIADLLVEESERRLEVVGNTWTVFDHRGFDQVLPQLLVCVSGFGDIGAEVFEAVAQDVGKSGVQLLLDGPSGLADLVVGDCLVPANLDEAARDLPALMHQDEPAPGFFALHEMPNRHAWRSRPVKLQYRVPVGVDEHGQPVEIDLKSKHLQDGMGPHGEVIAPADKRAEAVRALVLGLMARHSPDELQVVLVDFHGSGVFAGIDGAPHIRHGIVDLLEDHEQRTRTLAHNNFRNIWDYRAAGLVLPELLVCVDGVQALLEERPEFAEVLRTLATAGRTYGQHLLLCDAVPGEHGSYRLEFTERGWVRRIGRSVERVVLPTDLNDVVWSLPIRMAES
ncbi:FtsK/SpoIIIE domain-containing protein [Lentzea sp. HUAS12]|uniref:FtsK/SpoIIIE domain-containing protein n=1 Tax=Lentzea sp. HUAS12 TaxID=2951806 RepID=UPI00209E3CD7|nr:FtsK/SpoIIIE domain-containing protein [Lentzea sp. HUAS12]USX50366.1 FtsK/SpoIIIE domain-containing protein [Lentzea sp. HUAS12]